MDVGHIKFSAIIETASALANLNKFTEDDCCDRLIALEIGEYLSARAGLRGPTVSVCIDGSSKIIKLIIIETLS